MLNKRLVLKTVRWLLVIAIVIYVVTGFGITEYRTVESLTFGMLTKNLSHHIHTSLDLVIPFLILLAAHILLPSILRVYARLKSRVSNQE